MLHLNSHLQLRAIVPSFRSNFREPLVILYRNHILGLGRLSRTLSNYGTNLDPTSTTILAVDYIKLLCNGRSARKHNLTSPLIPSEDRELVKNYNVIKVNVGNLWLTATVINQVVIIR